MQRRSLPRRKCVAVGAILGCLFASGLDWPSHAATAPSFDASFAAAKTALEARDLTTAFVKATEADTAPGKTAFQKYAAAKLLAEVYLGSGRPADAALNLERAIGSGGMPANEKPAVARLAMVTNYQAGKYAMAAEHGVALADLVRLDDEADLIFARSMEFSGALDLAISYVQAVVIANDAVNKETSSDLYDVLRDTEARKHEAEQIALLSVVHPDWREVTARPDFRTWAQSAQEPVRTAAVLNAQHIVDAEGASLMISEFKAYLVRPAPQTQIAQPVPPPYRQPVQPRAPQPSAVPPQANARSDWDGAAFLLGSFLTGMAQGRQRSRDTMQRYLELERATQARRQPTPESRSNTPLTLGDNGPGLAAPSGVHICPDGSYVGGGNCRIAPDGTYVSGQPRIAPDGTYTGGAPRLAPDGSYVGGAGRRTMCPDGSYVAGNCRLAPDGSYVGVGN
jgi:hypothetical protein